MFAPQIHEGKKIISLTISIIPKEFFPIGRLDKYSEGLILLTNDGDIVNKILRARNNHEKEYIVHLNKPIKADFIQKMGDGSSYFGYGYQKMFCRADRQKLLLKIILTQGLNRQIRRMCEYFDYKVAGLKRIRIMNINLDVEKGKWRHLSTGELKEIQELVSHSDKTHDN